ncbi:MAG: mycobacterial-type methylenetetrahydrofolate reductase [Candidatus Diapherotrites archaeon]|nr:mycobacterial-type methylenetetrahydrofolate reductase [Candidatus Diapherotrites archaeon]
MLEVPSPAQQASMKAISQTVEKIATTLHALPCVDWINIPEIIEENHEGKPLYRNMDTRDFGILLRATVQKPLAVNKVVVHSSSAQDFETWLKDTLLAYNIENTIFVGGNNNTTKYSGISVLEANKIAQQYSALQVGNIAIPERTHEVERMIAKTESGCKFFTTQILFESNKINSVLQEYEKTCTEKNLKPATVFLTFAPVTTLEDVHFVKWLGAQLSAETEQKLTKEPEQIGLKSVEHANQVLNEILHFREQNKLSIPVSLNIETLALRNLPTTKQMVDKLSKSFGKK